MLKKAFQTFFTKKSPLPIRILSWITAIGLVKLYYDYTTEPIEEFKETEVSRWNKERLTKIKQLEKMQGKEKE